MGLIEISDEEYALIIQLRERNNLISEYHKKQGDCPHIYVYSGHSHNDDCYTCVKCGNTEFR